MLKYPACLLLLSVLAEAFHHHDNGADHSDCPICVATHHQSDTGNIAPVLEIQRLVIATAYVRPVVTVVTKTFNSPANDRAPPA